MNALGWQIGAVLIGASALIIGIYIGKLLNTTNKVVEKVNILKSNLCPRAQITIFEMKKVSTCRWHEEVCYRK